MENAETERKQEGVMGLKGRRERSKTEMQSRCGQQENRRENDTIGGNEKQDELQNKTGNHKFQTRIMTLCVYSARVALLILSSLCAPNNFLLLQPETKYA